MILIYTEFPNLALARRAAQELLAKRLVVCVNFWPIKSLYRWRGRIDRGTEVVWLAKTSASVKARAIKYLRQLHPYQLPVIVYWTVTGSNKSVNRWLKTNLSQTRPLVAS